jgi:hypothetical protein
MTFKVTAAVLALLPMLAGAIHCGALRATHPVAVSTEPAVACPLRVAEPAPPQASMRNAMLFSGVVDAARQAGRAAHAHVPEPKALLWLGLALLLFGLWRGRQDRNRESK